MNAVEQTGFMGRLREANPQLAHLSTVEFLDQAAEDTEEMGKLAETLRVENPDKAHLSAGKLIGLAIKENPDAFTPSPAAPTWQPFPPESGSLNIPRSAMPQIRSEHRGAMVQFLKGRGIVHSQEEVLPHTLKPSQAEFSPEKVDKARSFDGPSRRILVSSDNHVLDGHHQWIKDLSDSPDAPVPAIRFHAPIQQLLLEAARFPSSGVDEPSEPDTQTDVARGVAAGQEQLAQPAHQQPQPQPQAAPAHDRRRMRRTPPPSVVATHQPSGSWESAQQKADFQRRAAQAPAVSSVTGRPTLNPASVMPRSISPEEASTLVNNTDDDAGDARKAFGQSVGQVANDALREPPRPVNTMSAVSPDEHSQALERRAQVDARDAEIEKLIRQNVEDEAAAEVGISRTTAATTGQSDVFDFHVNQLTKARMNTLQAALSQNPELSKRTPQELANAARDLSSLEDDPSLVRSVRQGAWSGAGNIKHDLGNVVDVVSLGSLGEGMPGLEKLKVVRDALHDAARRDQDTVQLSRELHADEEGFTNELARGVGDLAFASGPKLLLSSPLEASQLPLLGAVSGESEGKGEALKGAVVGWLYHGGMSATAARMGRVGNALFWTGAGTVEGVAEGKPFGTALAGALPMGALAAAGGERRPVEVTDAKGVTRPALVSDLPAINSGELKPVLNALTGKEMAMPARGERGAVPLAPGELVKDSAINGAGTDNASVALKKQPLVTNGKFDSSHTVEVRNDDGSVSSVTPYELRKRWKEDPDALFYGVDANGESRLIDYNELIHNERLRPRPEGVSEEEAAAHYAAYRREQAGLPPLEQPAPELPVEMTPEKQSGKNEAVPHPESRATLEAQIGAMTHGRRAAVLVTPGSEMPFIPKGYETLETEKGVFVYDPEKVSPDAIDNLIAEGRHDVLLGHIEPKSETTTVAVVARHPETGAELQTSYASPDGVETQKAELLRQFPGAKIETGGQELEARILDERASAREGEQAPPVRINTQPRTPKLKTAIALYKAGLVTGPKTHLRNLGSTAAYQMTEEIARTPAAVVDLALSTMTGVRTTTGPSLKAVTRSSYEAATRGLSEAKAILKEGATQQQLSRYQVGREINSGSKILDAYVNTTFRLLSAEDHLLRVYALRRSLEDQARAWAMNEKRNGKIEPSDLKARAQELVANPPAEMQAQAVADSEAATFNDGNTLNSIYEGARRQLSRVTGGGATNAALDVVFPFTKTPANIVKRLFEMTPVGGAAAAVRATKALLKGNFSEAEQRALSRSLGRSVTGTGLILFGYALGKKGLLTGSRQDYDEARKEEAQKRPPGSLLNPLTNTWHQVSGFAPFGNLLVIGATLAREDSSVAGVMTDAATEQPLLRNTQDIAAAVSDPEKQGQRIAGRIVAGAVPTIVSDVASSLDSSERTRGSDFWNQIAYRVPGWRNTLPEKVDANGHPLEHRRTDFFDPTSTRSAQTVGDVAEQSVKPLDVEDELHRLYKSVNPSGGMPRKYSGPRLRSVGIQTVEQDVLPAAINSDTYRALASDEDKLEFMGHIENYARKLQREGYSSDAVRHNSTVLAEVLKLQAQIDDADLPARRKAQLKDAAEELFKYSRQFKDDERPLSDVQDVFRRKTKESQTWLDSELKSKGQ